MDFSQLFLQLGGLLDGGSGDKFDPSNPLMYIYIISLATIPFFMFYGQRMQGKVILGEISKSQIEGDERGCPARLDRLHPVGSSLYVAVAAAGSCAKGGQVSGILCDNAGGH